MTIADHKSDFNSSEVMRSLERVAIDKGMVELDPVVKVASKQESYEASGNLQEDILKLAKGLREKGYKKEADALEDKVFDYKRAADAWYDVTGEEGDDLIDFAHPDGDVSVGEGEYGIVETITSTQKKIRDKIEKTPTGKQSSAKNDVVKEGQAVAKKRESLSRKEFVDLDVLAKARSWIQKHINLGEVYNFVYGLIDDIQVEEVTWNDEAEGWSDEDEAEYVAGKLQPLVSQTLSTWAKHGYMPSSIWSYLKSALNHKKSRYIEPETMGVAGISAVSANSVDVYQLWLGEAVPSIVQGIRAGEILLYPSVGEAYRRTHKEEDKSEEKPEKKRDKQTRFDRVARDYVKGLNVMIEWLDKNDIGKRGKRARDAYVRAKSALTKKPGKTLADLREALKYINREAINAISLDDLNKILEAEYRAFEELTKSASFKSFTKKGQDPSSPSGAPLPPSPGDAESGGGLAVQPKEKKKTQKGVSSRMVGQIQEKLVELADALEKAGYQDSNKIQKIKTVGSEANPYKPDNIPGDNTKESLQEVEEVRKELEQRGVKGLSKINVRYDQNTLNAVSELIKAVKSSGVGYAPDDRILAKYEIKNIPVNIRESDLYDPSSFLDMLVRSGLISTYQSMGAPTTALQPMEPRANLNLKQIYKLAQRSDIIREPPFGKKKSTDLFQVQEFGLNIQQWKNALDDVERAARRQLKAAPSGSAGAAQRQNAVKVIKYIQRIKVQLNRQYAKPQGIKTLSDPRIVNVSTRRPQRGAGTAYGPGYRGPWGYGQPAGEEAIGGPEARELAAPIGPDINLNHPIWRDVLMQYEGNPGVDALMREGVLSLSQWRRTSASSLATTYAYDYSGVDAYEMLVGTIATLLKAIREVRRRYAEMVADNPEAVRLIKQTAKYANRWTAVLTGKLRVVLREKKKLGPSRRAPSRRAPARRQPRYRRPSGRAPYRPGIPNRYYEP